MLSTGCRAFRGSLVLFVDLAWGLYVLVRVCQILFRNVVLAGVNKCPRLLSVHPYLRLRHEDVGNLF